MKTTLNLGRPLHLRVRLHPSWAVALLLIISIMVTQFPDAYPFWERVALGIAASFLFLAAVLLREVLISLLAVSKGIPVKEVTIFFFGGVSHIAKEETTPTLELLLGVTGLLTNIVMAGVFYGLHAVLVNAGSVLFDGIILWLAYIYVLLAFLHFVPVFPLDGGRIMRMLLWKATGNYNGAMRIVSWAGQVTGLFGVAAGVLLLYSGQFVNGLVLLLVGWILFSAATQSHRPVIMRKTLDGVAARDVIAKESPVIGPEVRVGHLVRDHVLVAGGRQFAIADGGQLLGLVTLRDIKHLPKKKWNATTVARIMTPARKLMIAQAEQPASSLLERMEVWQVEAVPVLERDTVIGVVNRDGLRRLLKTRRELKRLPIWK